MQINLIISSTYFVYFLNYLQPDFFIVKGINAINFCAMGFFIKNVYISSISTFKYIKMPLQFFKILKIGDIKIKIRIRAN